MSWKPPPWGLALIVLEELCKLPKEKSTPESSPAVVPVNNNEQNGKIGLTCATAALMSWQYIAAV